jgi:hypothetical protein
MVEWGGRGDLVVACSDRGDTMCRGVAPCCVVLLYTRSRAHRVFTLSVTFQGNEDLGDGEAHPVVKVRVCELRCMCAWR